MNLWAWLFRRAELKAAYRRIEILEVSVDYLRATLDLNARDAREGQQR